MESMTKELKRQEKEKNEGEDGDSYVYGTDIEYLRGPKNVIVFVKMLGVRNEILKSFPNVGCMIHCMTTRPSTVYIYMRFFMVTVLLQILHTDRSANGNETCVRRQYRFIEK